jgi:ABC-2 type transport system permease protein
MAALALRQWGKTAAMAASARLAEGPFLLAEYPLRWLRVIVLLSIWRLLVLANPEASPLALDTLLTYALVAELVAPQIRVRTELTDAFWQGTIAQHYLRPMGLVAQFAAPLLGGWLVDLLLFSLPLLALAPWLGVDPSPASLEAGLLFGLSLALCVCIGLALEFLFAALTVALEQPPWLLEYVRGALIGLLSGMLIPPVLWPWGLGEIVEWLPFASLAWAPLAIYTGAGEPLLLLSRQLAWALLLWPIAGWMWLAYRERVVGLGG